MAKRVISEEASLPEPLIQYIQSFLSGKEAAQTTILSKSWYKAWLTRPNIDFNQSDFRQLIFGDPATNPFSIYSKKTLQRYADLNLKIESFKLGISGWERAGFSLADVLISKAIEIGAVDIKFELSPPTLTCTIPRGVLGSETLTRLSVRGCKIEDVEVRCWRLKSLYLCDVWLEEDMIWDVLLRCRMIEDLALIECKSFSKIHNLQNNNFVTGKRRMLALCPLVQLHKLRRLSLDKVKITTLFFSDFSSRFPCLKELDVHYCFGYKEIQIYSHSLELISVAQKSALKASFDVPSIRKFSFEGRSLLPSLAFNTLSREWEWESNISIYCKTPSYSWFLNLNKMLTNLSSSTIYLSIDFQCGERSFDFTGAIQVLPVVQNLTLHASCRVYDALLDGIFWSCRPMFIILHWLPGVVEQGNEDLLVLLFKTLTRQGREFHPYLYDLKEVCAVQESVAKCRPLLEYERTLCFQLHWALDSFASI